MAKQWRNAVVGTGVVGDWHVRLIPKVAGANLVAVCDLDVEKAKKCLERHGLTGVNVYANEREMLKKEQIDVVHVCTPSGNHMKPALMAMEAGCNVICEKPMEIRLDRIDKMIETADKKNVKLAGIFQTRYFPFNRAIKDAADAGRFGRIAWAGCITPWYRTDEYYRDGGWRGTWKLDGGGAIMNQSVHAVDLIQWIGGPVTRVSAYAASRIHPEIEVEDTLSCSLQFANGAFGTIVGSTAMWPGTNVRVEIGGENGMAVAENSLKMFKFREERPGDAELLNRLGTTNSTSTVGGSSPTDVPQDPHLDNITAILRAWENGREADTYGPEARKAIAIILAMYRSAKKNGAPVKVE